jgi:hypothetical protein
MKKGVKPDTYQCLHDWWVTYGDLRWLRPRSRPRREGVVGGTYGSPAKEYKYLSLYVYTHHGYQAEKNTRYTIRP